MLEPIFSTGAQIDTFKQGEEEYVMMTFFFTSPSVVPDHDHNWRPPIDKLPVSTIIMPRAAYRNILTKFLGYMARQEEGKIIGE